MRLKEVFLDALGTKSGEDVQAIDIKDALTKCDMYMKGRIGYGNADDYFFKNPGSKGKRGVKSQFYELMYFWEVYLEYDDLLTSQEKYKYEVLHLVHEADALMIFFTNMELRERMSEESWDCITQFCDKIEAIYNSKWIVFFDFGKMAIECKMSLARFERNLWNPEYELIQNKIIDCFYNGGVLLVISGSKGLTPQRYQAYEWGNQEWKEAPSQALNIFFGAVMDGEYEEIPVARVRGFGGE